MSNAMICLVIARDFWHQVWCLFGEILVGQFHQAGVIQLLGESWDEKKAASAGSWLCLVKLDMWLLLSAKSMLSRYLCILNLRWRRISSSAAWCLYHQGQSDSKWKTCVQTSQWRSVFLLLGQYTNKHQYIHTKYKGQECPDGVPEYHNWTANQTHQNPVKNIPVLIPPLFELWRS